MSNNKQSSVEWLYNKMYEHRGNITIEEYEQAKAMHKEEIENAYDDGWHNNNDNQYNPITYYNKKFGGNND